MFPGGVEDAAIGQEARRYAMRANMDAAKAIELARHLTGASARPAVTGDTLASLPRTQQMARHTIAEALSAVLSLSLSLAG